ncbi:PAS domain S-box-containing protein/diguanylate cyclase (GGDEF) domain-containing protein [Tropicibacter naphthalenivorans]|uniref:Cyclic di-GMP phosphodiesterase Gmr n=1 Tax=Tropicibacter naphthalenivorans TaxID=441103 RepID=A0A0P1GD25_9RHOB|nr:Cyclic di-GMP phosphodiesterase Gmr [Tropicibacter naphthalenivorans]SMC70848.1 PAS domain S-box-containing protein/diguanylate cyclase (GGDEF) domain-containing protein [Tropicibacter naphthalenivorans]
MRHHRIDTSVRGFEREAVFRPTPFLGLALFIVVQACGLLLVLPGFESWGGLYAMHPVTLGLGVLLTAAIVLALPEMPSGIWRKIAVGIGAFTLVSGLSLLTFRWLELQSLAPAAVLDRIGTAKAARHVSVATLVMIVGLSLAALFQAQAWARPRHRARFVTASLGLIFLIGLTSALQLAGYLLAPSKDTLIHGMGAPTAVLFLTQALAMCDHPTVRTPVRGKGFALRVLPTIIGASLASLHGAVALSMGRPVLETTLFVGLLYGLVTLLAVRVLRQRGAATLSAIVAVSGHRPRQSELYFPSLVALELWALFRAGQRGQRIHDFIMIFTLAVGAIALDAASTTIAGVWWANFALIFLVLFRPLRDWPLIALTGLTAMVAANTLMGHSLWPTVVMSTINSMTAVLSAAFLHRLLLPKTDGNGWQCLRLTAPRLVMAILGLGVVVMIMGTVSSAFLAKTFETQMSAIWVFWVVSDFVGGLAVAGIAIGLALQSNAPDVPHVARPRTAVLHMAFAAAAAACGFALGTQNPTLHDMAIFGIVVIALAATFHATLIDGAVSVFVAVIAFFLSAALAQAPEDSFPWTAVLFGETAFLLRSFAKHREAQSTATQVAMFERGPIMMATYDSDQRIVSASNRLADFVGSTASALVGKPIFGESVLFLPEEERLRAEVFHACPTDEILIVNGTLRTHDGQEKPVIVESRWSDGPTLPFRFTAQFTDVSDFASFEFANVLLSKTDAIIMVQGPDKRVRAVSEAWVRATGYSMEESIGVDPSIWLMDETAIEEIREQRNRPGYPACDGGTGWRRVLRAKDGRRLVFIASGASQTVAGETLLIMTLVDVTALEKQHEAQLQYLSESPAASIVQGEHYRIISVSEGFKRLTGYSDDDLIGNDGQILLPETCRAEVVANRGQSHPLGVVRTDVRQIICKDGREITMRRDALNTRSVTSGEILVISAMTDLSAELEVRQTLEEMALRDPLTGLYVRRYLTMPDSLPTDDCCLIALDIDHFKSVNDSFGHDVGDRLLVKVADALKAVLPNAGVALRTGGEEFCIWAPWLGWRVAEAFAETLREAIADVVITTPGGHIGRTASIGVAHWQAGESFDRAFQTCDTALRAAKENGRDRVVLADHTFKEAIGSSNATLADIEAALRADDIVYHLQPVIDCARNRTIGYEALVRWDRGDAGNMGPASFLGGYLELTSQKQWLDYPIKALVSACHALPPEDDGFLAVNLAVSAVAYDGAARHLARLLAPISQKRKIVLEISEQSMSHRLEVDALRRELLLLKDAGFEIALDDFGREASNLDRLLDLPISWLKLDRCLIARSDVDQRAQELLRHMPDICKAFDAEIIAEGVETAIQRDTLIGLGITIQQGYLHGRPAPAAEWKQNTIPFRRQSLSAI